MTDDSFFASGAWISDIEFNNDNLCFQDALDLLDGDRETGYFDGFTDPEVSGEEKAELFDFWSPCPLRSVKIDFTSTRQHQKRLSKQVVRFTDDQKAILNNWFCQNRDSPYPRGEDIDRLMEYTGLSKRQIQVYFTNKRTRSKKVANFQHPKRLQ